LDIINDNNIEVLTQEKASTSRFK